jgi:hypothetical protein
VVAVAQQLIQLLALPLPLALLPELALLQPQLVLTVLLLTQLLLVACCSSSEPDGMREQSIAASY